MNRILIAVAAVLVLVAGGVLAAPEFIDWNRYRGAISAQVEQVVGHRVIIAGDIDFAVLPHPALSASGVHIVNPDEATAADLASVAAIEIRVAFVPLLRGDIQVRQVILVNPVVDLEILPSGQPNWSLVGADGAEGASPFAGGLAQGLSFDSFITQNATVTFRDPANGIVETFDAVNAEITADSLAGPFYADGAFTVRGIPFAFNLATGDFGLGRPTALRIDMSNPKSGNLAGFTGAWENKNDSKRLTGSLRVEGTNFAGTLRDLFRAWETVPPKTPGLGVAFSVQTKTVWTPGELVFNDVNAKLGEITGTGAVNMATGPSPRFDGTLAISRVDLDALLARADTEAPSVETVLGIRPTFSVPQGLTGSLVVGVEAVSYNGRSARRIDLAADVANGVIGISRASALLPGVTEITASGTVRPADGLAQFDGDVTGRSDNLRDLMGWLGQDFPDIPADRLRTLAFEGKLRARRDLLQAYGFDLRFDTTRVSGAAAYAFRERPAFSIDIAVDRVDLDSYRRRVLPVGALGAGGGATPDPVPQQQVADAGDVEGQTAPWAVLNSFDSDIKIGLAELVFNEEQVKGIALDLGLLNGAMTVREAAVSDLAGAALSLTGIAGGFDSRIGGGGNIKVTADDPTGLAHLAGIDLGPSGSRLGPLVFNGSVDGDQDRLVVDVGMMADGAELWVRGTLGALAEDLTMDVAYGVAHPNFPDLAQALAWRGLATGAQVLDGPVSLRGTAAGTLLNLQIGVTGALAGADVGVVGTMAWSDRIAYSLQASVTHDHAAVVLAGFGMGPGNDPDFGPLQLRGAVDGDGQQLTISGLQATIGPTDFTGTANLGFGSDLLRMGATVAATELDLAAFFPRIAGPGATDDGDIRRNWSVEPIDFSVVEAANLDLNLTAETLDGFGLAFTDASLSVRTANGVLAVDDFHGNGLGGAVAVALTVTNGAVPSLEGTLDLAGADLSMLPGFGWDFGVPSGTANAHFDLKTVGASERELVANLEGSVSLEAADGMLEGFSLANFNGRFAGIKDVAELNALMQPAMRSGQTPFVTLRAEAAIRQGVIEFEQLAADLPFGIVETTGEIDLPRRRASFDLEFLLTEFSDAPPFGISLAGPWDAPRRSNNNEALLAYVASRPPLVEIIPPTPEPVIAAPVGPVVAPTPNVPPIVPPVVQPEANPTPTPAPAPIAEAVALPTPAIQPITAPEPGQNPAGTPDAIVAPALTPEADAPPAPLPGAEPVPQPAPAPAPAPAPPPVVEAVPEPDPEPAPAIQPGGLVGPAAPAAPDSPAAPVVEGAEPADGGAPGEELTPAQQLQEFLQGIGGLGD